MYESGSHVEVPEPLCNIPRSKRANCPSLLITISKTKWICPGRLHFLVGLLNSKPWWPHFISGEERSLHVIVWCSDVVPNSVLNWCLVIVPLNDYSCTCATWHVSTTQSLTVYVTWSLIWSYSLYLHTHTHNMDYTNVCVKFSNKNQMLDTHIGIGTNTLKIQLKTIFFMDTQCSP